MNSRLAVYCNLHAQKKIFASYLLWVLSPFRLSIFGAFYLCLYRLNDNVLRCNMAHYKGKPKKLSIYIVENVQQGATIHLIRICTHVGTFRRLRLVSTAYFLATL